MAKITKVFFTRIPFHMVQQLAYNKFTLHKIVSVDCMQAVCVYTQACFWSNCTSLYAHYTIIHTDHVRHEEITTTLYTRYYYRLKTYNILMYITIWSSVVMIFYIPQSGIICAQILWTGQIRRSGTTNTPKG